MASPKQPAITVKDPLCLEEAHVKAHKSSIEYPALAFLQDIKWTSQADLTLQKPPECFMGPWHAVLPSCQVADTLVGCSCKDNWETPIEYLVWNGQAYRLLQMLPAAAEVSRQVGQRLMAQAFFSYNARRSQQDRGALLQPSLYLAIWDRKYNLPHALEVGITRLQLINANALTAINLNPQWRQTEVDGEFSYDYGLSDISSVPGLGLQCDESSMVSSYRDLCRTSVELRFTTFEVPVRRYRNRMDWTDVVAQAGAYISLFQILAWILSGLAIHVA
ncbi:hypothetical protein S40288_11434 [Stachybotrys chartarum IBT 40288]|nr:hypothetical protein S40288_11434 [Stachybotrys chartarum IBT 40288]